MHAKIALAPAQMPSLTVRNGLVEVGETRGETSNQESESRHIRKDGIPRDATVLVVEDNVQNFVLMARMLGYLGIHCEWKTSGSEVVEYADALPRLDLILMDIRLPYEDGYSALRKIRSSPAYKQTRVVVVTADACIEQVMRAKQAGFDGFLGKPLDMERFPDQIRRILTGGMVWELA